MAMEFSTPGMQPAQCWLVRSGCPINGSMKEVKSSGDPVALTWMNSIWYNAVLTQYKGLVGYKNSKKHQLFVVFQLFVIF